MGKKRQRRSQVTERLPEGCQHYEHVSEVPWDIQKCFLLSSLPGLEQRSLPTDTSINATAYSQSMTKGYG